ncbi:MAG: pilus assembly protein TadG-related protein [Rhodobacteraceae bacterium]|nr:pilus assembly protein TadG-related protein [Paracoccaceae bacterium]
MRHDPDAAMPPRHRRRFRPVADESGAMVIFGVYLFVMMLMVAGIGVDLMRAERDRTELQNALDRAVLAAADMDQQLAPATVVADYMQRAGLRAYLGDVTVGEGVNFRSVAASASRPMDTQFMHMTGVDRLTVPARSAAMESRLNIEISLVLDISGSMRSNNRMTTMRVAARQFVDQVLEGEAALRTSVSVVPYAGHVNPGRAMFDHLGGLSYWASGADLYPPQQPRSAVFLFDTAGGVLGRFGVRVTNFPGSGDTGFIAADMDEYHAVLIDYMQRNIGDLRQSQANLAGAVIETTAGATRTIGDIATLGGVIAALPDLDALAVDAVVDYDDFFNGIIPNVSSCIEITPADFGHQRLPESSNEQVGHFTNWASDLRVMDWGWCPWERSRIRYAQNDPAALGRVIDDLRMGDGTGTTYGIKYAVSLLDPSSRSAFAHLATVGEVPSDFSGRPADYNDGATAKYIVLMTDGQITDQFRPVDKLDPVLASRPFNNLPRSYRSRFTRRSQNLDGFYAQCDLAKGNGVVIFTIAFDAPAGASDEMRRCASSASHFFQVAGRGLNDAFAAIAGQINQLRLTQ